MSTGNISDVVMYKGQKFDSKMVEPMMPFKDNGDGSGMSLSDLGKQLNIFDPKGPTSKTSINLEEAMK